MPLAQCDVLLSCAGFWGLEFFYLEFVFSLVY
jgi:hypothetical protein